MVLGPCGGDMDLYKGFGWPGLKKIGVKISEVLNLALNQLSVSEQYIERTFCFTTR